MYSFRSNFKMICLLTVSLVMLSVPMSSLSSRSQYTPVHSAHSYPPILQTLSLQKNHTLINSGSKTAAGELANVAGSSHKKVTETNSVAPQQKSSVSLGQMSESHNNKSLNGLSSQEDQVATYPGEEKTTELLLKLDRDYNPAEIAEYIYRTGDEKGFTQVIADMMEDGQVMASTDDLIMFLESVQRELSTLRREYHEILDQ